MACAEAARRRRRKKNTREMQHGGDGGMVPHDGSGEGFLFSSIVDCWHSARYIEHPSPRVTIACSAISLWPVIEPSSSCLLLPRSRRNHVSYIICRFHPPHSFPILAPCRLQLLVMGLVYMACLCSTTLREGLLCPTASFSSALFISLSNRRCRALLVPIVSWTEL